MVMGGSGSVFLCSGGSISWFSRKQVYNSLSTSELEFVAESKAAKKATWIRYFSNRSKEEDQSRFHSTATIKTPSAVLTTLSCTEK
jgi:hypothetical protein